MTAKFVKRRGTIAVVEAKAEVDGKLSCIRYFDFCYWKLMFCGKSFWRQSESDFSLDIGYHIERKSTQTIKNV